MGNLLVLTEAVTETPEVTDNAFNLIEWVGENPAFVNACLSLLAIAVGVICFLVARKRKK